jgi:hypothetical protein
MLAVLAEDHSDAETLAVLAKIILGQQATVYRKGFDGCASLCRKGSRQIELFRKKGVTKFVVCHDADRNDPGLIRQKIQTEIVAKVEVTSPCIVVPVQEIEAWIIADENAVAQVIPSFRFKPVTNPELIEDPKEWIERASRGENAKPLYAHAVHNPKVAAHLDFSKVLHKCPSFRPFKAFLDACLR